MWFKYDPTEMLFLEISSFDVRKLLLRRTMVRGL
jgi:hypothetical protein